MTDESAKFVAQWMVESDDKARRTLMRLETLEGKYRGLWKSVGYLILLTFVLFGLAMLSGCMPYRHSWVQRPGVYVEGYPGWTYQQPVYVPRDPYRNLRVYRPGIDGPSAYEMNKWGRR